MSEYINRQDDIAVKLMAKSYFVRLKQTETITSDALTSDSIEKISKAMKDSKRSVTQLNFAYKALVTQLPSLKTLFDKPTAQFIQDVGKNGGVLEQHFKYVKAGERLYANISVLAAEVDQATSILETFRSEVEQQMKMVIANGNKIYITRQY
jgi:methyl-accepting chemotaxis protein